MHPLCCKMEKKPTKCELRATLKSMAGLGRSPGIDGLTIEVFHSCWHFIEDPYFDIVLHFWDIGQMYHGFNQGVLKLIPKKADRRWVRDWRPIAMLTTTHKLLTKLLDLCLCQLLFQLINAHQTSFVPRRQILENISIICMTIDWALSPKHQLSFCNRTSKKHLIGLISIIFGALLELWASEGSFFN